MRRFPLRTQLYIAAVIVAGSISVIVSADFRYPSDELDLLLLLALVAPGALAGAFPLPLIHRRFQFNLAGGVLLISVFLAPMGFAVLLAAMVGLLSGALRRRAPWNAGFTAGVNAISVGVAAVLYSGTADPSLLPLDTWSNALGLVLAAFGYWLSLSVLVAILVAARNEQSFTRTFLNNWKDVYVECILLTLLAVLGAVAWHQGPLYSLLLLLPAIAIYQLLSFSRLKHQQAVNAIEIIAEVLDRRAPFTFQHSDRVALYATRIGRSLKLGNVDIEMLRRAAIIHDIGKLGVDDPSDELRSADLPMTPYQFYSLKQHAQLGAMIAREIPAFEETEDMIRYHHDWYDGSYSSCDHLGDEIPLGARIIAVAECYDGMCMANGEATLAYDPIAAARLRSMAGQQLDPVLTLRFLALLEPANAEPAGSAATQPLPSPVSPQVNGGSRVGRVGRPLSQPTYPIL